MRNLTVSTTDIIQFQNCRRRWLLGRLYEPKHDAVNLWFGTLIHHALEAYYRENRSLELMLQAYESHAAESLQDAANEYGELWQHIADDYYGIVRIGEGMLRGYAQWDQESPTQLGSPIAIEKRLYVPLGEGNYLAVRMDMVSEHDGNIIITDHKTASKHWTNSGRSLDLDEQLTSYAFAFCRITGHPPNALVYDVLYKEIPAEPTVLKNGTLSKAVSQPTTRAKYLAKIQELGQDPDDYFEILDTLEARGWDGFFRRETTYRNVAQVDAYADKLTVLFTEMRKALKDHRYAYPSPSVMKCPSCPFLSVCQAIEDGSDYHYLLETSYNEVNPDPWKTPKRLKP